MSSVDKYCSYQSAPVYLNKLVSGESRRVALNLKKIKFKFNLNFIFLL
jgi:hypothetical protein